MIHLDQIPPLSATRVKYLNGKVLQDLELDDDTVPGEIRLHEVVVARYKGAPARDCEYLLNRLFEWLDGMSFELGHSKLGIAILKSIVAHLYLSWIHPFGDGNGRVARLVEYQILLSAGVPNPATHLLSNHYNETRSEYYRRLDRASRDRTGVTDFLVYALQGFVDGLTGATGNHQRPDKDRYVGELYLPEIPRSAQDLPTPGAGIWFLICPNATNPSGAPTSVFSRLD